MGPWMFRGGGMWVFPVIGLVMRYAKGEIGREEFERMKKDISEGGQ